MWVLYGWFSGLMCVGRVFGAVTWAFWMQFLVAEFTANAPGLSLAQVQSLLSQTQYWSAAFYVPYAIEFLCLSVAKLLVLHRMADFAVPKGDGLSKRLAVGGRVVMAAVVVGNVWACAATLQLQCFPNRQVICPMLHQQPLLPTALKRPTLLSPKLIKRPSSPMTLHLCSSFARLLCCSSSSLRLLLSASPALAA